MNVNEKIQEIETELDKLNGIADGISGELAADDYAEDIDRVRSRVEILLKEVKNLIKGGSDETNTDRTT